MPRSVGKPNVGRIVPSVGVRVRAYPVMARAVEEGVSYGIRRLWKYHDSDTMTEDYMRERAETIADAVMSAMCEVIDFDTEPEP